jgi:16S rRNA (guanine(1405)-N(7))-methyltransferase
MKNKQPEPLEQLVDAVLESSKYRSVSEEFIRSIGAQELAKRRKLKDAIKATKNKLHQVGGAFLGRKPDFTRWLEELRGVSQQGGPDNLRQVCAEIMAHHSSTRERLPILDQFYEQTLGDLSPISSILDIACGLNPLAAPWMPLAGNADYYAYDIYDSMIGFVDKSLALMGVRGHARLCDVLQPFSSPEVEVALILKAIPCLEQIDKSAGHRLLDSVAATHVLVSFPARSLCGRNKGMVANYESRFRELMTGRNWSLKRFEFETELVFRISK